MAKKSIIQFEYDWDFILIGLVTTSRDYQLCWLLNKFLNVQFRKTDDIEMSLKRKNKLLEFCHFRFDDEINKLEFHIISNKSLGENLIPEYRIIDYLLIIKGYYPLNKKTELLSGLKTLTALTALIEINAEELMSRENLILE